MPLSLYWKASVGLAASLAQDVLGRPPAGLLGDRAQLGERAAPSAVGDVRDVADRVDAWVALDGQVGLHVDASAAARDRVRRPARSSDARFAASPHDGPGGDGGVVVELDPVGVNRRDTDAQPDDRHPRGELLKA